MAPRPPFSRRVPVTLAAGAFAVATAVTPALAADDPGQSDQGNWSQQGGNGTGSSGHDTGDGTTGSGSDQQGGNGGYQKQDSNNQQGGNGGHQQQNSNNQQGGDGSHQAGGHHGDQGTKGVVTARRLALRSASDRGSRVIRYAHKGEVVSIFCKVPGDKVNGNPLWYLLTDGTWAWGPAGHIDTFGPAPRWC